MTFFKSSPLRGWMGVAAVGLVILSTGFLTQKFGHGAPNGPSVFPKAPPEAMVSGVAAPPVLLDRVAKPRMLRAVAQVGCGPWLTATAMPGSAVRVNIAAPCHPGQQAVVRHAHLAASGQTDADGHLTVLLPALDQNADVQIEFADDTHTRTVNVPSAAAFQHVVLKWTGDQVFHMHAFEFGAAKSQMGHVWAGSPKTPVWASRGTGGYLTRLVNGTGPSAEIYSFPAGQSPLRGVVRLVVEATVTDANCGKVAEGIALQTSPLGGLRETEIAVEMPECSQIGETVQLQNLLQDMRLAGR